MKTFVQLTRKGMDIMGSGAVCRLDSRLNGEHLIEFAKLFYEQNREQLSADGFRVFECESLLGSERVVYEIICR